MRLTNVTVVASSPSTLVVQRRTCPCCFDECLSGDHGGMRQFTLASPPGDEWMFVHGSALSYDTHIVASAIQQSVAYGVKL